jgi:hypothetical protein
MTRSHEIRLCLAETYSHAFCKACSQAGVPLLEALLNVFCKRLGSNSQLAHIYPAAFLMVCGLHYSTVCLSSAFGFISISSSISTKRCKVHARKHARSEKL